MCTEKRTEGKGHPKLVTFVRHGHLCHGSEDKAKQVLDRLEEKNTNASSGISRWKPEAVRSTEYGKAETYGIPSILQPDRRQLIVCVQ